MKIIKLQKGGEKTWIAAACILPVLFVLPVTQKIVRRKQCHFKTMLILLCKMTDGIIHIRQKTVSRFSAYQSYQHLPLSAIFDLDTNSENWMSVKSSFSLSRRPLRFPAQCQTVHLCTVQ